MCSPFFLSLLSQLMRMVFFYMVPLLIALASCGSAKQDTAEGPITTPVLPLLEPMEGLAIRVLAEAGEADSMAQFILVTELDLPEGSHVISALSDRDYLGKFNVTWQDTAIAPSGPLTESPPSMPGWEPFDKVYTPMMMTSTTLRQQWETPPGKSPIAGQVFFVLEPQCVAYAMDFTVEKEPYGWSATYGLVYKANPG